MSFRLSVDLFPITSGQLRIRKTLDDFLVYDIKTKKSIKANRDLIDLLFSCNGKNSIRDISYLVYKERKINQSLILERIIDTFESLSKERVITFQNNKLKREIGIFREYNFKFPLTTVYLEPTRYCNFTCIHCYASSHPHDTSKKNREIKLDRYLQVIDKLDDIGIMNLCFTGGEPFVREDISSILSYTNSKNIEIGILSNGSLLDAEKISMLGKINPKFVGVSFDSHKKEIYEKIRGKNTYELVLNNIKNMVSAGINVHINSILFRGLNDSYEHITEFLYFCEKIGIGPKITFDEFVPEGRGKNKEFYRVNEKDTINNIHKAFKTVFSIDFGVEPEVQPTDKSTFCGLGVEVCCIKSNGDVTLCPSLNSKEYILGNIEKDKIKIIWENSDILNYFRNKEHISKSECSICNSLEKCRGGCKSKSLTFYKKFNAPDPWLCAYFDKTK